LLLARSFFGSEFFPHETLPAAGMPRLAFLSLRRMGNTVSLKDYRGKWVALYFYPKDLTPGCTKEAHNFQRDQVEFARRNAVVLGVSVDSADSHKRFCSKEGLISSCLADTSHAVSKQYGSLINFGVTQISARNTFLIDPEGKIAKVFAGVSPAHHSTEVLAALMNWRSLARKPSDFKRTCPNGDAQCDRYNSCYYSRWQC